MTPHIERAIESILLSRVGAAQAIRGAEVVAFLRAAGMPIHIRRVGETAMMMRRAGHAVLSDSVRGYWMADTVEEVNHVLHELRARRRQLDDVIGQLEVAAMMRVQARLYEVMS